MVIATGAPTEQETEASFTSISPGPAEKSAIRRAVRLGRPDEQRHPDVFTRNRTLDGMDHIALEGRGRKGEFGEKAVAQDRLVGRRRLRAGIDAQNGTGERVLDLVDRAFGIGFGELHDWLLKRPFVMPKASKSPAEGPGFPEELGKLGRYFVFRSAKSWFHW